jgi:hypothetical protein
MPVKENVKKGDEKKLMKKDTMKALSAVLSQRDHL